MKKYTIALGMISFLAVSCGETDKVESENLSESNEVEMQPLEYRDFGNDPFVFNIEDYTRQNDTYRTALWTGEYMQLTVMSILPGEDIGLEVHDDHDQFIRVEEGEGIVLMGDTEDNLNFERKIEDDFAVMIPAGKWHNVVNNSDKPLKLYSIYAPKEHPHGAVHKTRAEGIAAEETAHDNH